MVGYSFWGFLGDTKYDKHGKVQSTPDGNAFYSWSIIRELRRRGKDVVRLMQDRDDIGFKREGMDLFSAFARKARFSSYCLSRPGYSPPSLWEYVILEWRWPIPGRNTKEDRFKPGYQPDLLKSYKIIDICNKEKVPLVVFDLDYKLTEQDIQDHNIKYVIELGTKWTQYAEANPEKRLTAKQVKIPFDFSYIHEFPIMQKSEDFSNDFVYVGNRYERDWCIDKYIPKSEGKGKVYGNWLEGEKDSANRWPHISFGDRLQTKDMYDVYSSSVVTPLLAKMDYCSNQFMTARLIESVFYGCVPLFIEEYGESTIKEYAGNYSDLLTIGCEYDIMYLSRKLRDNSQLRNDIILYLREHLRFMDAKFFIDDIERMLKV